MSEIIIGKDQGVVSLRYALVLNRCQQKTLLSYHQRFSVLYHKTVKMLKKQDDFFAVFDFLIKNIAHKRQKGLLAHSSLRQYKASINYALSCLCAIKNDESHLVPTPQLPFYKNMANFLSLEQIDKISLSLVDLGQESYAQTRVLEAQARSRNQTSTQRMKHLPGPIYDLITSDNKKSRSLLKEFVFFNCMFGLRPNEWLSVKLFSKDEYEQLVLQGDSPKPNEFNDEQKLYLADKFGAKLNNIGIGPDASDIQTNVVLMVKNSKYSHGRACGEYRYLHFKIGPRSYKRLKTFIKNMQGTKGVLWRLQNQFRFFLSHGKPAKVLRSMYLAKRRVYQLNVAKCLKKGKEFKGRVPVLQHPTLYSTRHQAIANQKFAGVDSIRIAAMFGHISPYTAKKHYAHQRHGTSNIAIKPDNYNIALVAQSVLEQLEQKIVAAPIKQIEQTTDGSLRTNTQANTPSHPAPVEPGF